MKEIVSTITGKGQVTIPSEIRRRLGVAPSDKVAFVLDDAGKVELRAVRYTVASLCGIVPPLANRETVDFDDQIAEAFEEGGNRIARDLAR